MQMDTSWFLDFRPDQFIAGLKIAAEIFAIFAIAYLLQKIIQNTIQFIAKRKKSPSIITVLLRPAMIWPVYIIAAMITLSILGIQPGNLWTFFTAAATLIAIGFVAVWSVLSNLLCTFMLVVSRPFKIGDELEMIDPAMTTGMSGQVRNINLLFTTLMKQDNENQEVWRIHIPNNLFFQKIIKCKSMSHSYSLEEQLFLRESLLKDTDQKQK